MATRLICFHKILDIPSPLWTAPYSAFDGTVNSSVFQTFLFAAPNMTLKNWRYPCVLKRLQKKFHNAGAYVAIKSDDERKKEKERVK